VKIGPKGAIKIPRVDIAMDCGYAVHPDRVRSQCEGAVIMSLSFDCMIAVLRRHPRDSM